MISPAPPLNCSRSSPARPRIPSILAKVVPGSPDWKIAVTPPPPELDYEPWIGPARMEPYIEARVHMNWRWNYNIGGGQLLDWIGHHCDIAHWGMDWTTPARRRSKARANSRPKTPSGTPAPSTASR